MRKYTCAESECRAPTYLCITVDTTKMFLNNLNARSLYSHCTHKIAILYTYTAYIISIRFAARKSRDSQRCSLTGAVANTGPVVVVGAHLAKNIGTHITLCLYYLCILTPCVCLYHAATKTRPSRIHTSQVGIICVCSIQ